MKKKPTKKQKDSVLEMTKNINYLKLRLSRTKKNSRTYKMLDELIDKGHAAMNKERKKIGMKPLTRLK